MLLTQELNGALGYASNGSRKIKSGAEYNRYFGQPIRTNPVLRMGVDQFDTINRLMPDIISRTKHQTAQIAVLLKRATLDATCKAIWQFVFDHIQYHKDNPMIEELRQPVRTWADRKSGVDCDCYSIFISTILCNLNIPHSLRMCSYKQRGAYQHIYVIVPKINNANLNVRSEYIVIDDVMDNYNEEKKYLQAYDKTILGGANNSGLNGLGETDEPVFSRRSDRAFSPVFYNHALGTWAMRCTDGSWAIRGDKNKRYVDSLNGASATNDVWVATPLQIVNGELGWITEAVSLAKNVGGKLISAVKNRKANKAAKKAAKVGKDIDKKVDAEMENVGQEPLTIQDIAPTLKTVTNATAAANAETVATVKSSNRAIVTSLSNVNQSIQNKVDTAINSVKDQLDKAATESDSAAQTQARMESALQNLQLQTTEIKQQASISTWLLGGLGIAGLVYIITKRR
ncbi:MAG: hypothetical protein MJ069_09925 [Salinivirgaceae bacterium]|nr:hypothetical protein [Salinivirgaceae bacterium]